MQSVSNKTSNWFRLLQTRQNRTPVFLIPWVNIEMIYEVVCLAGFHSYPPWWCMDTCQHTGQLWPPPSSQELLLYASTTLAVYFSKQEISITNIATTYCVVSWFLFLSTLIMYGYMPAHRAALTTAQFSELVFKSRISPGPLARTKPEALSWPRSCVLFRKTNIWLKNNFWWSNLIIWQGHIVGFGNKMLL